MRRVAVRLEQVEENEWKFEYPESIFRPNEKLYNGIDLMKEGRLNKAEKIFRTFIKEFPEHFGAIDFVKECLEKFR